MIKLSNKKLQLMQEITDVIKIYNIPLLDPSFNALNPRIGSGTLIILGNFIGILTAKHVVDDLHISSKKYIITAHPETYQAIKIKVETVIKISNKNIDLAFILLSDNTENHRKSFHKLLNKSFFNINQQFMNNNHYSTVYVLYGCVDENKQIDNNIVYWPNAGPYFSGLPSKTTHFKIYNFSIDTLYFSINLKQNIPSHFHGMSGGGLWKIAINEDYTIKAIELHGVIIKQKPTNKLKRYEKINKNIKPQDQDILCHGPIVLNSFYNYCIQELTKKE